MLFCVCCIHHFHFGLYFEWCILQSIFSYFRCFLLFFSENPLVASTSPSLSLSIDSLSLPTPLFNKHPTNTAKASHSTPHVLLRSSISLICSHSLRISLSYVSKSICRSAANCFLSSSTLLRVPIHSYSSPRPPFRLSSSSGSAAASP